MESNVNKSGKPTIALAMGDPAGISAELTAKAIALPEVPGAARLVVIGDRRVFDEGARVAQVPTDFDVIHDGDRVPAGDRVAFMDLAHTDPGRSSAVSRASPAVVRRWRITAARSAS